MNYGVYLIISSNCCRHMLPQMFRLKLSLLIHWHCEPLQSLGADFWGGLPKQLLFLQCSSPYSSNLPQDPILKYCIVSLNTKNCISYLYTYSFIYLFICGYYNVIFNNSDFIISIKWQEDSQHRCHCIFLLSGQSANHNNKYSLDINQ
jgi:hypothetical protein